MKNKLVVLLLSLFMIVPFALAGCRKGDDPVDPPVKANVTTVVNAVADKMVDVANTFAGISNNQDGVVSRTIAAPVTGVGYRKATLGDFLEIQEFPSQIIYVTEYCLRNATKENGYANGFELNKVYFGIGDVGYEGAMYFVMNEVAGGITLEADLHFEVNVGGNIVNMQYAFNGFFGYDYDKNEVNCIQLNYIILPIGREILSIKIDFANNSYHGFNAIFPNTESMTLGTDFLTAFNAGNLTLEEVTGYDFDEIVMCSGNLSDNINGYTFDGYVFDEDDSTSSQAGVVLKAYFNGVYNELKSFKFRNGGTDNLDVNNATLINYLQDAIDYGTNKGWLWVVEDDNTGREYYNFPFLEYSETINVLNTAKTLMDADSSLDSRTKDLIADAISYLVYHGENRYVGNLGTWDGLNMKMEFSSTYENTASGLKFYTFMEITANNGRNYIRVNAKDQVTYSASIATWKNIYDAIKNLYMENYSQSQSAQGNWLIALDNSLGYRKDSTSVIDLGVFGNYTIASDSFGDQSFIITNTTDNKSLRVYFNQYENSYDAYFTTYWE